MSTFTRMLGLGKPGEAEDDALERLRRVLRQDPRSLQFVPLADACRRRGHFQEAISVCIQGLGYHPSYVSGFVALARTLHEAGELDRAREAYERVVDLAPQNLVGHLGLGELYEHSGALLPAYKHLSHALRLGAASSELSGRVQRLEQTLVDAGILAAPEREEGRADREALETQVLRAKLAALDAYRARFRSLMA